MRFLERILNAIEEQTEQGSKLFEKRDVAALKRMLKGKKFGVANPLVRFFREEEVDAGNQGDHDNITPEECAIRLIRELRTHNLPTRSMKSRRAHTYVAYTREGRKVVVTVPED